MTKLREKNKMYQYKREPLSNEDVTKLINACKSPVEKLTVLTLLDTGLRINELATLTKENVHWQERRLIIKGKGGPYGKKSKRRIVPMTERVYTLLASWFNFQDDIGLKKRTLQYHVRTVATRAGIKKPVSPHVLRHTFAVQCIKRGISTKTLQLLLGHDHLTTTEIYLNMSPEDACREFTQKF